MVLVVVLMIVDSTLSVKVLTDATVLFNWVNTAVLLIFATGRTGRQEFWPCVPWTTYNRYLLTCIKRYNSEIVCGNDRAGGVDAVVRGG